MDIFFKLNLIALLNKPTDGPSLHVQHLCRPSDTTKLDEPEIRGKDQMLTISLPINFRNVFAVFHILHFLCLLHDMG